MLFLFQHETFAHLYNLVKQYWFAVASILENVLVNVKVRMSSITEVFLRSDNAGCYHCGHLWEAIHRISKRTGLYVILLVSRTNQLGHPESCYLHSPISNICINRT